MRGSAQGKQDQEGKGWGREGRNRTDHANNSGPPSGDDLREAPKGRHGPRINGFVLGPQMNERNDCETMECFLETKIQVRVWTSDTLEMNKVSVGVSFDFVGDPLSLSQLFGGVFGVWEWVCGSGWKRGGAEKGREDRLFGSGLLTVSRGLSRFVDMFLMMSVFFLRREICALDLSWERGGERGVLCLVGERESCLFCWMVLSIGRVHLGWKEGRGGREGKKNGGSARRGVQGGDSGRG